MRMESRVRASRAPLRRALWRPNYVGIHAPPPAPCPARHPASWSPAARGKERQDARSAQSPVGEIRPLWRNATGRKMMSNGHVRGQGDAIHMATVFRLRALGGPELVLFGKPWPARTETAMCYMRCGMTPARRDHHHHRTAIHLFVGSTFDSSARADRANSAHFRVHPALTRQPFPL